MASRRIATNFASVFSNLTPNLPLRTQSLQAVRHAKATRVSRDCSFMYLNFIDHQRGPFDNPCSRILNMANACLQLYEKRTA